MKFLTRSILIVLALYGLVFAIGAVYIGHSGAPLWVALAFPVVMIGIQYLLSPHLIEWLMDVCWYDQGGGLPAANREFVERLCAGRGLKVPRIGIIQSGTPNAFSFGRLRSDARVVVTSGLLEVLTPEEANAVLAHEIGHIEHWDFAVMTVATLAPLLLYQFYVYTEKISSVRVIAYTAYLGYLLSQFVVLLLNRTREYFADHYASEVTRAPDALSSALVKISYGMVRADGEYKKAMAEGDKEEKTFWRRERRLGGALGLMGISNLHSGAALALGRANPTEAAAVMRWDLVNPWAKLYELNSTHPLTALRVRELNRQAGTLHQAVQYPLPIEERTYSRGFPLEVLVWAAPALGLFALWLIFLFPDALKFLGIALPWNAKPLLLIFTGVAWMLRVIFRYRGEFQDASIGTLIEDLEVSQMRPRAVRLRGEILGRGQPGAFWSPDLVLRDSTGIIFMLYRQSIPLVRFLFAVTAAENYVGQEVVVEGWFRRGLAPYVEMSKLTGTDNISHRTYSRWVQLILAAVAVAIGWLWLHPS
jgi:Zn-dependent protease with chaperone function